MWTSLAAESRNKTMGVPKKSRKGKKAWRKNIDASEVCMAAAAVVGLRGVPPCDNAWRVRALRALYLSLFMMQVERFIEETTHQDRRGTAVEQLADEELFFVDKVRRRQCRHPLTVLCTTSRLSSLAYAATLYHVLIPAGFCRASGAKQVPQCSNPGTRAGF